MQQPPNGLGVGDGGAVTPPSYIFALGKIEPRFPSLGVEKEFFQATGRAGTSGLTDREALERVLSGRPNRYLVRQICWVLTIEGLETYILMPRDPLDYELLTSALRPTPRPGDFDLIIGVRGPIAPPETCNGLTVPFVGFDQIYSFDVDTLVKSIPRPENIPEDRFSATAEELFNRIIQLADNAGATDEHRAMNFLAVRYPAIYAQTLDRYAADYSLTSVEVRPSRLSNVRRIYNAIFSYTNRNTDVTEKYFVRVDMTEEFPFLLTKMSPYYDR